MYSQNTEVSIFQDNDKYGLLDENNNVILKPIYDKIIAHKKYNLYITKKENHFSFVLKQWKNEKYFEEDLWIIDDEEYDSLVFSEDVDRLIYLQNGKYGFIKYSWYPTYRRIYEYSLYKIEKEDEVYDTVYFLPNSNLILKQDDLYGIRRGVGVIIPPQFDTAPYLNDQKWFVNIKHLGKYGILHYRFYSSHVSLDFDAELENLRDNYFFARKNGLWGVVYVRFNTVRDSEPWYEIVPFEYADLDELKRDYRHFMSINYSPFDKNEVSLGIDFTGNVFTTTIGRILQLNFISDYANYNEESFKIQPFTPYMKGKPIVQDSTYEYLINKVSRFDQIGVLKIKRDTTPSEYRNYFIKDASGGTSYMKGPRQPYDKRKIYALQIYEYNSDSIQLLHSFEEESDSIVYQILYSGGTGILYRGHESGFEVVLKSIQLKNNKYLHEFYDYYGDLLYSVKSKYPINQWKSIGFPLYEFSFYKKKICRYNGDRKRFFK